MYKDERWKFSQDFKNFVSNVLFCVFSNIHYNIIEVFFDKGEKKEIIKKARSRAGEDIEEFTREKTKDEFKEERKTLGKPLGKKDKTKITSFKLSKSLRKANPVGSRQLQGKQLPLKQLGNNQKSNLKRMIGFE